jgi:hypothetical protein
MRPLSLVIETDLGFHGTAGNKKSENLKHISSKPHLPSVHGFQTARKSKPTPPLPINCRLKPELKHKSIPAEKIRKPKTMKYNTKY